MGRRAMPPLDTLIPAVVVFVTFVVGLDLTPQDFRRAAQRRSLVLSLTAAQALLLPPLAAALAWALALPEPLALGLVLAGACPGGTLSNVYTLVGRGNVALSVTLTAFSNAAAFATLPVGFALATSLAPETGGLVSVPAGRLLRDLALGMLAPLSAGLLARRCFLALWSRSAALLKTLCLGSVLVVVALLVADQAAFLRSVWRPAAAAAMTFTLAALTLGAVVSIGSEPADRVAIAIEFGVRNFGLATLIAVRSFGRRDVAALAAVVALTQVLIFLAWRLAGSPPLRDVDRQRATAAGAG